MFDPSKYYPVEAEERRFICPTEGCDCSCTYILYPIESERDGAIQITCPDCQTVFWWSRKLSKLFHGVTHQEIAEQNIMLVGKVTALQLKTPEQEK